MDSTDPEPESGTVIVGVDRLVGALLLFVIAGFATFGVDGGWCCGVPALVLGGMFVALVWSDSRERSR